MPKNVIDAGNFRKLEQYFEGDIKNNAIYDIFGELSITSCAYGKCRSQIRGGQGLRLYLERGLNIYALYDDGKFTHINTLDHCGNDNVFNEALSLKKLIEQQNPRPKNLMLISEDTTVCNDSSLPGISNWISDFKLNKLKTIKFRHTYIGIIDVKSGNVREIRDRETIKYQ